MERLLISDPVKRESDYSLYQESVNFLQESVDSDFMSLETAEALNDLIYDSYFSESEEGQEQAKASVKDVVKKYKKEIAVAIGICVACSAIIIKLKKDKEKAVAAKYNNLLQEVRRTQDKFVAMRDKVYGAAKNIMDDPDSHYAGKKPVSSGKNPDGTPIWASNRQRAAEDSMKLIGELESKLMLEEEKLAQKILDTVDEKDKSAFNSVFKKNVNLHADAIKKYTGSLNSKGTAESLNSAGKAAKNAKKGSKLVIGEKRIRGIDINGNKMNLKIIK